MEELKKKFWCHYIGNDGKTPKRRSIELTRFDSVIPFENTNVQTPIWCEIEDDEYNEGKHLYPLYVQISDRVALYINVVMSEVFKVEPAKKTEEEISAYVEELYNKWINPNMSEEGKKRQREHAERFGSEERDRKERFFETCRYYSHYTEYLTKKATWIKVSDIRAYEEAHHPALPVLIELRKKFQEEFEAKRQERKRKEEEERLAREEKERQEAIAEKERLDKEEVKFQNGESISGEDVVTLCKRHGINVHLRTIHNLQQVICEIDGKGNCSYYKQRGKRKPVLDGCYKTAEELYKKLNEEPDVRL